MKHGMGRWLAAGIGVELRRRPVQDVSPFLHFVTVEPCVWTPPQLLI
jgi:hypothetical protein